MTVQQEMTIPAGYLKDRKGRLVPQSMVDAYDLEMDAYRQALRAWKARHPELPQA